MMDFMLGGFVSLLGTFLVYLFMNSILFLCLCRIASMWEELQTAVDKLSEA